MNLEVKWSIGRLNAYNTMYFNRNIDLNITENKYGQKKLRAIIRRTATKDESYFNDHAEIKKSCKNYFYLFDLTHHYMNGHSDFTMRLLTTGMLLEKQKDSMVTFKNSLLINAHFKERFIAK